MTPHRPYYKALRGLFPTGDLAGLAHVTGGGMRDNLARILPPDVDGLVDLDAIRPSEVFGVIRERGNVVDEEMLRTFNLGVGLIAVCGRDRVDDVVAHLAGADIRAWPIGETVPGEGRVSFAGGLTW